MEEIETVALNPNPVPLNVIEVPTGPEAGLTVSRGVTVNAAEAVLPAASEAETACGPAVAAGTGNEHENAPVPEVVVEQTTPPRNSAETAESTAKLDPLTVTTVPTGPEEAATETNGETVNATEATFDTASVPENVYGPGAVEGIVNGHPNDPDAPAVPEQAVPPTQVTRTVEFAAYPSPENVTAVPTGPRDGLTVSVGTTVTVVAAVLLEPSVPTNACAPAVVAGTLNVQLKLPSALVAATWQAVPPLHETVTGDLPANPVPLNVTLLPAAAGVGAEVRRATTVTLVDAEFPVPSVATNTWDPPVAGGRASEQPKLPTVLVVAVQAVPALQPTVTGELDA